MADEPPPPNHPQAPLLSRLPLWLSRWLGYRDTAPAAPPHAYVLYIWPFIGAFCGLSLPQAIFGHSAYFIDRGVPPIIASFGASAVLCYGAIDSPLAQPRALIGGHFFSAFIGIVITTLFDLPSSTIPTSVGWLPPALSTAIAMLVMQFTRTTHPPAGATALLPAVDPAVRRLGWYYLPVVLLSAVFLMLTALLVNNVQRRWPLWWFEPAIVPVRAGAGGASAGGAHMPAATSLVHPVVGAEGTSKEVSRPPSDLEAAVGTEEGNGVVA